MATLVDSSVLIAAERGKLDLEELFRKVQAEPIAIAAITASELLHGVHRAAPDARRRQREGFVESILAQLLIVPFDLVVARVHADIWAGLAVKGTTVGPHDLMIGATALVYGYKVATRDQRSFRKIPGLHVELW